ncbi:1-deoxy-D-xylulose-5-phosphate reductoisomerase [Alkalicoccus luteus]|uniref:1-deoxy-D-xylulose 5-phosphate reductoisomerase n=1 Tax=Alkalicoccus luteus TaxID=1237094 RepID=A0A969PQX5_9BACI|nr:1-deoxy-D-xylulose-5-phosphate reductoisomerase [Alkalicoccus luteus]NJP36318.1 1-deoxy-D-xylulose-5-phosphate reductoisomerase [Alkalicoccus luteus]
MKHVHLLGATGSIGVQTLDIIRSNPDYFRLGSLSFGKNVASAAEAANEFCPPVIGAGSLEAARELKHLLTYSPDIIPGDEGLQACARAGNRGDVLVNAVMGRVGLEPTLTAMRSGKTIAIANKETLVTAGHLVKQLQLETGVDILPVDSEHSAIYQCLHGKKQDVNSLILTASGGSFRDKSREQLQGVTVDEALNHPNWSMGAKITIDSATMMNKGLEVIEAHWLFDMPYEKIDVLLHSESIVHSMVEYVDGSVMAHLGTPDMRVPIQYALTCPDRMPIKGSRPLKLWEAGTLHFKELDLKRYKAFELALEAGKAGGSMPTVLNAANESAVDMFLKGNITFLEIDELVDRALEQHERIAEPDLEQIIDIDRETRIRTAAQASG